MKITIIVPAVNISIDERSRWLKMISSYLSDFNFNLNYYMVTESDGNFYGPQGRFFSKSVCINYIIGKIINDVDWIIQTDIDCIFPKGLIYKTLEFKDSFVHAKPRYAKSPNLSWEEYSKLPISHGEGGWNAAPSHIWKQISGYNDTIYGRGGEDIDLHFRINSIYKIPFQQITDIPLVHIAHPHRNWNVKEREIANHKELFKDWKDWETGVSKPPNYLEKYILNG